ncbi:outer membrane protein assembly factor BamB [Acidovorax sp. DW039]|uniref:outer membrane protein assembly factor BamB n=1 Tax=Acidovorax sp. DW039 TaxID=3095606 RepID=UPI0030D1F001
MSTLLSSRWLRVTPVVLSALLSACSFWGSSKVAPPDLGENVPLLGVRQVWTSKVGAVALPAMDVRVQDNRVLLSSADGVVAAIDARTGGDIWRATLGESLSAGAGGDGKYAAVVSRANVLIFLNEGRELWRQALPSQVFTAPLVAGGRVFVLSADRSVLAFDMQTGKKLWTQLRQSSDTLVLKQAGVIVPVGDTLVVGLSGRLVGLNPDTGTPRWEVPLASPRGVNDVERLVDLVGRVSRSGDSLCARAFQATVGCVNVLRDRASVTWTQSASGSEGVHGDAEAVYGTENNGQVIAWRREDGSRLWSTDRLKLRKLTAPLALGRSVVVGDDYGWVHFLGRSDGAPLNRVATDTSGVAAAPVVAADTLVVVTRSGAIYGFRPD